MDWQVAMKPGQRRKLDPESTAALGGRSRHQYGPRACPRVPSGLEHPFLDVKRPFGYAKVRYRGLAKNTGRLALLLGLANLKRARVLLAD